MRTHPGIHAEGDTRDVLTRATWAQQLVRVNVIGLQLLGRVGVAPEEGQR